jgi:hypothetical protein
MSLATETLNRYPPPLRTALKELRGLILETAKETEGVGVIEEALRWGQLSFITAESGSGSTVRIDALRDNPTKYAMFFHCQSGLIADFRNRYPGKMQFVGERSIEFSVGQALPVAELKHCVSLALTHHLRKKG